MRFQGYPPKIHRGSRKRLGRITLRDNWSIEVWIFIAAILFLLFVAIPWMVRHPPVDNHPRATDTR